MYELEFKAKSYSKHSEYMLSDKNEKLNSKSAFPRAEAYRALSGPRSDPAATTLLPVLTQAQGEQTSLAGLGRAPPCKQMGSKLFLP